MKVETGGEFVAGKPCYNKWIYLVEYNLKLSTPEIFYLVRPLGKYTTKTSVGKLRTIPATGRRALEVK